MCEQLYWDSELVRMRYLLWDVANHRIANIANEWLCLKIPHMHGIANSCESISGFMDIYSKSISLLFFFQLFFHFLF